MELCSKCYREYCVRAEKEKAASSDIMQGSGDATAAPQPDKVITVDVQEKIQESDPAAETQLQEKPVEQKNRSRCFKCNKRVGLLGFDCRCGYVFCSGHRHAGDGHECNFDHVAFDRKRLADTMEVVAASKIEKL